MDSDSLVNLISNVGFPIVVALYLMIRIEKKLDMLIEEIKRGFARLS